LFDAKEIAERIDHLYQLGGAPELWPLCASFPYPGNYTANTYAEWAQSNYKWYKVRKLKRRGYNARNVERRDPYLEDEMGSKLERERPFFRTISSKA
jgi:hypothetical protein